MNTFDLHALQLDQVENAARRAYLDLVDAGITHARMAEVTGEPASTFSMWLSGYRTLKRIAVLDAIIQGLAQLEEEAEAQDLLS